MEFASAAGLLLVVLVAFSVVSYGWTGQVLSRQDQAEAGAVLDRVYYEAQAAKSAGPGYYHSFYLPPALSGGTGYLAVLDPATSSFSVYFSQSSVSRTLTFRSFLGANITGGKVAVTNEDGVLAFS